MEGIPCKTGGLRAAPVARRALVCYNPMCKTQAGPLLERYTFSKTAFSFCPAGWKTFPRMDRAGAGHPTSILAERGRIAAPNYRELYLEMFRANEAAIRLLQQAQARAEAAYLAQEPPPLRLQEKEPPPQ